MSFDRRTLIFRPNDWRGLKTKTSHRVVPLWPQLEKILRQHVFGRGAPPGRLLFPSLRAAKEQMITDWRKSLDRVAERCGWPAGEVRSKALRHTYRTTRLQTLDRGAPVSPFTVAREMGHGGRSLVARIYGHLGDVGNGAKWSSFQAEQHADRLGERLEALR